MSDASGNVSYKIIEEANGTFSARIKINPAVDATGWRVTLTFDGEISDIFRGQIVSKNGNTYVIENKGWAADLSAGQAVTFKIDAIGSSADLSLIDLVLSSEAGETGFAAADAAALEGDPGTAAPASLMGALSTDGNAIVNASGEKVQIEAVNWFGLETTTGTPHGLWVRNWQEMLDEIKATGFNAIRLPFSLDAVVDGGFTPNGIDYGENPDLAGLSSLQILDKIVGYAEEIELGIILDNHRSAAGDGPNGNGLWVDGGYSEADWIAAWETLATRYGDSPAIIGADLANEPHGAQWNDWAAAAERAGNAVLSKAPDWLILVEGVGQYEGEPYWWGGNLKGVADRPVELSVDNKLVYSPHDYPASVYPQPWFSDGSDLTEVFRENWGYIHEEGIAPILLGEFGSYLETPADQAWADAIVSYLNGDFDADGAPDAGANPMHFSWWSWNPNSGDTGGILLDDWRTLRENAVDLLDPLLSDAGGSAVPVVRFAVTLDAPAAEATTIDYATVDGTAIAGEDYVASNGTLTFSEGETSKFVDIAILPDLVAEGTETFSLNLTGPAGSQTVTGTILGDDGAASHTPTVAAANVDVAEEDGEAVLTITLSEPSNEPIVIAFETDDRAATAGEDYAAKSGTVIFAPGETQKTVAFTILDDQTAEANEAFKVKLSTQSDAVLERRAARILVRDTDDGTAPPDDSGDIKITGDVVDDWGSGATVWVRLENDSDDALNGWTLSFNAPAPVSNIWGATILTETGTAFVVEDAGWNASVAPGAFVEFGFTAATVNIDEAAWLQNANFDLLS